MPTRLKCSYLHYIQLRGQLSFCRPRHTLAHHTPGVEMDSWRVAVLGDGGVGKTALAVQVSFFSSPLEGSLLPRR